MKKLVYILLLITLSSVAVLAARAVKRHIRKFTLRSTTFDNNGWIPEKCARAGGNVSPELHWENAPRGTKSFVLAVIDVNPVAQRWVHWMVINIPASYSRLSEGASYQNMPPGSRQLKNSWEQDTWNGPQPPPKTGVHIYVFTLYALNVDKIKLQPQQVFRDGKWQDKPSPPKLFYTEKEMLELFKGKIIGKAVLKGKYELNRNRYIY
ncbi:MAG: YbhB/YbcL family Raf kinase inhibitor-like protein [Lentisphaerae bacterium]|nr:YbhB/YbcL family Raf kinase inhibitor-like protein [Lentisphaerota bacterium]MCP4100807.1 YbhB/YbcL family Raf kinase inhibitor-like protein [Lentisphaerota bacterium]